MESGAGGNWKRYGERKDASVIQQTTGISCMAAVGQMLLRSREISISQEKIRDIIGEPADSATLADALNRFDCSDDSFVWRGLFLEDFEALRQLLKNPSVGNIAVVLREPATSTGHAVMLGGISVEGIVSIQDPFDQTSYEMKEADFDENWGLEVIARWYPINQ